MTVFVTKSVEDSKKKFQIYKQNIESKHFRKILVITKIIEDCCHQGNDFFFIYRKGVGKNSI